MNKWLLSILFLISVLMGCGKGNSAEVDVKAQAKIDDKIITDYITAHNLTTAKKANDTTGVYYIVLDKGEDNDLYTLSTQVTVGDTARLLTTGAVFSQTNNFHPSYILGQVIVGWQLGIPKIGKGGRVRLLVPSRDGFGQYPQTQLGLPANAVLDFDIQLYDITN
jgi:FKBP-type peptidyl-prolyl cis-trans isomerase FkpA